jgi:hypothetical protein
LDTASDGEWQVASERVVLLTAIVFAAKVYPIRKPDKGVRIPELGPDLTVEQGRELLTRWLPEISTA